MGASGLAAPLAGKALPDLTMLNNKRAQTVPEWHSNKKTKAK
jgi:hypothetical protein